MRSLVLPPSNTAVTGLSFCRELLLGSDSVSWACLRWRFGLTTKGLHFQITPDSAQRIYQTQRACALQDGRGQVTTAAWEGWFRLSETWSKNLKSKSIHGPPVCLSDFFVSYFPSKMELLLLFPLHHTVKKLSKEELLNSGILHPNSRFSLKRRSLKLLFWTAMFSHIHL